MKRITTLTKIACFTLVAAALIGSPAISRAEDSTNAPAAQAPVAKKHGLPFHGKVASVDANAMTFTVGTMTIGITSTTKISKAGQSWAKQAASVFSSSATRLCVVIMNVTRQTLSIILPGGDTRRAVRA